MHWCSYVSCRVLTYSLASPSCNYRTVLLGWLAVLIVLTALPSTAYASLHTYRERPGQITYRSRQSLRDHHDRAWQAIAFKRLQDATLQGVYLRLVGFPGTVTVDRQRPITVITAFGTQWRLPWQLDSQTQALPDEVGQYTLQPLLQDLEAALPLNLQIPLADGTTTELSVAPFVVKEWLQIKHTDLSASPIAPSLSKKP